MAGELRTTTDRALRYHSRERRLSLQGVPELFGTHRYPIPTAAISAGSFVEFAEPTTFTTSIRITGATPAGLIFEIGDGTTAIAAWIDDDEITLRAGNSGDDAAIATFTNPTGTLEIGREFKLVCAVRPGSGRVRLWSASEEIARATAVNGQFPAGWAADSVGAFAAAAAGALPADVAQTGAPSDFDVIQPLLAFAGQVPRHFH